MAEKKRCAIIGAGVSGFPAGRWALAYGWEPVIFEMQEETGGLWRYKEEDSEVSTVMKSTVINTSKEMTAYSDFPPPATDANYMHNTKLLKYLRDYAEAHGHRVNSVRKAPDYEQTGRWVVHFTDNNGEEKEETFDAVLSAVGHHAHPNIPQFPGQEEFQGKIIHSKQYRDHRGYEDKNVVVLGVGNSGLDVACELGRLAKQVYLSTRRGVWVCTKVVDYGLPLDLWLNRRINFYLRKVMPDWFYPWLLERKLQQTFDHDKFGLRPAHSTVSQHLVSGQIVAKPNIRSFTPTGVVFEDNTKADVDAVVFATGYSFFLPLIPVVENRVSLYKGMYPSSEAKHNTLAIIGLLQPIGSLMPISEMQARFFFSAANGETRLPTRTEMDAEIAEKLEKLHRRYNDSPRHTIQVDYTQYMNELSSMMGCDPRPLDFLFSDPALCFKMIFGPDVPYLYRLRGPHSWKRAREAILGVDERFVAAIHTREGAPKPAPVYELYVYGTFVVLIALLLWILFLN
ncbi:Dimethylaniline monooxygenase [N-oxide-forming] [Aphelenchoides fujianensis]|nr:Dimethylaniline monooxygenase [N-oxide-forming] [Aphelenchoides fujianensis]